MNTIVIYQTNTGFTKKYATWIGKQLNCDVRAIEAVEDQEVIQADFVVYGGWIFANKISGFSKIIKLRSDRMVVFAVGAAPAEAVDKVAITKKNHIEDLPFFYFRGGLCFEKMSFSQRTLLKMFELSLNKKSKKTDEEKGIENALAHSYDSTDIESIEPLTNYCQRIIQMEGEQNEINN